MSGCPDEQAATNKALHSRSELTDALVEDVSEKMANNKISPVPSAEPETKSA